MLDARVAPGREVLTDAIDGWRTWTLAGSRDGSEAILLPIAGTGKTWPRGSPARAECGRRRHHRVPGLDCTCGIHATHTFDLLRRTRDPAVLGMVALWGRVLEHEHGYRAEFGYPQRLALVCPLCFWQWGARGSNRPEVVVRRRGGRLVPLCGPHLELCRRYGYPARRVLDAGPIERAVLDAYAVDVLRVPGARSSGAERDRA
ncbi:MAG: hypothetical protein ACRDHU_05230 [Actinomycetota bacterium]